MESPGNRIQGPIALPPAGSSRELRPSDLHNREQKSLDRLAFAVESFRQFPKMISDKRSTWDARSGKAEREESRSAMSSRLDLSFRKNAMRPRVRVAGFDGDWLPPATAVTAQ